MRPSSKTLAMRDPAAAAILGIIGKPGSDFGADFQFGYDFGAEAAPAPMPTPAQTMQLWQQHRQDMAISSQRERLLQPNKGSDIKVMLYSFSVNAALTLSVGSVFAASGNPDTNIRPQREIGRASCRERV